MTPDGARDERGPILHQQADVDWMKSVDVLGRRHGVEHAALGPRPICAGSGAGQ